MTMVSGFGWLRGQIRAWLNDLRHFVSILVFQLILGYVIAKVIVQNNAAQYAGENARSVTWASIDFRPAFDYNNIVSSNQRDWQCV